MSFEFRCDRCGLSEKDRKPNNHLGTFTSTVSITPTPDSNDIYAKSLEICFDCHSSFERWMNSLQT
jgi:hypothetical protein